MSKKAKPQKHKGLGAGFLAFGAVFALYSVLFHPHSLGGYVLAFALSGFAGAIIRTMAQGLDLTVKDETPESLKKVQGDTGNPDVDELLQKGREMITEIRAENDKIPDSSLSEKLDTLENQCAEIFRAVYDKPAKASQIRKFMAYYLPTTLKIVKGYRMLEERGVSGAEAVAARRRIDDALGVVLTGCDKMLENLYRDDVLDITTDIDVLEQMLKRDGLTEGDLERAAAQAREAARIDHEATRIARERSHAQSGVEAQVASAVEQAQAHQPQAPTLNGGMYPTYGGEAMAQAPKKDEK
ncbi:MAG: 5-bromo-4-chloroindolyl phosphate hydrolysis family protein [Clostridiales bacterium]|nr:5-bromo-4-chloroindolyl phosphate hydrolysis family protein [Clostridiales bacterium]